MPTDNTSNMLSRGVSTESTTNMLDVTSESDKDAPEEENETPFKSFSFGGKVKYILYNMRLEVLLLVHITFYMCSDIVVQSLMLEKACSVNLGYPDYICQNLSEKNKTGELYEAEIKTQKVVSSINAWKPAVENVIPIAFVLFMGSWSDRHGRKMCILIPMFGFMVKQLGLLLSVLCKSWTAEAVILAGYIPVGITGSIVALTMALNSYVIDHCTIERRTFRIGILNAFFPIGVSIGMTSGGAVVTAIGYAGVFGMTAIAEAVCIVYIFIFIHDIKRSQQKAEGNVFIQGLNNLVDVFKTISKKRSNGNTFKLILLLMALFLAFWPMIGEFTVLYLFVQKQLDWTVQEFGFYSAFALLWLVVGSFGTMVIMVHKMKLPDELVGVISAASMIASNVWFSFVSASWMMYTGPLIGMAGGAVLFICRSLPTKLVEQDEIGKLNGAIAVLESVAPLVATPVFNGLYHATLETFPGALFLLTAATGTVPFSIYMWFYVINRKQKKHSIQGDGNLSETGKHNEVSMKI